MAGEWIAQLSDDLKANEAFTPYESLSDFAKAHLDTVGKVTELDGSTKTLEGNVKDLTGRLANSIPKLGEKATDEDKLAFYTALGVPQKSEEYEFPKGEGVEHDENMITWARDVFHKAHLSKDQGALISQAWDGFIQGMLKSETEASEKAKNEAEAKLKTEWGADYDKNLELTKRGWKKFTDTEFDAFCEQSGIGNASALISFIFNVGKAMGEDFSPPAKPPGEPTEPQVGMNYQTMDQFKESA